MCNKFLSGLLSRSAMVVAIGAFAAGLVPSVANADDRQPFDPWYATLGAGYTFVEKDEEYLGQQTYEARLGYRFDKRWGAEFGFAGMPDVRARKWVPADKFSMEDDTWGMRFSLDALYYLDPEAYRASYDPYVTLGGGINVYDEETDDGHNDLFLAAGLGAFIPLSQQWFLKPDYRLAMVGHDTEVNHFALIALGYRWGGKSGAHHAGGGEDMARTTPEFLRKIYFAFDSANLSAEARSAIEHNAKWLKENPNRAITLEGHCDERGTLEYNIELGQRRAQSVFRYLVSLGIPESRLATVSYGEEFPADPASTPEAWAKNRRVEFALDGTVRSRR